MKFCVIDNGSKYLDNILQRISVEHEYFVLEYLPFQKIDVSDADMVILSGGMVHEAEEKLNSGQYYFQAEFDLINNCSVPIFGICLGLQIMTVAMGGKLGVLPKMIIDNKYISLNKLGRQVMGNGNFIAHKYHRLYAINPNRQNFEVLASSGDGPEIIMHKYNKLLGVQFHPEIDVDSGSENEFWRLIAVLEPSMHKQDIYA